MIKLNNINRIFYLMSLVVLLLAACKDPVDLGGQVSPSSIVISGPDTVVLNSNIIYNTAEWFQKDVSYNWSTSDTKLVNIVKQSKNVVELEAIDTGNVTLNIAIEGISSSKSIVVITD